MVFNGGSCSFHGLCLPVKIMTKKIRDIIGKFIGEYVELIQKKKFNF